MTIFITFINSILLIYLMISNFINKSALKYFTFIISLILYISTIFIWIYYNPYISTYQFYVNLKMLDLTLYFGIDGLSLLFLFLTSFLFPFCILYNWNNIFHISNEFNIIMISMEILLIFIFITNNLLFFYICFEAILIPLFILIGINNYRTRRIHASYMLFLYTLFGSMFMLTSILILYSNTGSFDFLILNNLKLSFYKEKLIWFFLFLSLSVKIPVFPFHIWLPEAHVEAPTEGSVLLAGVLLKLGVYGFIRLLIPVFYQSTIYFLPFIFTISLISGIYTSFTTLRQTDLKKIIAYSSVAHMSIGLFGLFTLKTIGIVGSLILMFSHGIVSGGLFLLIGFLYDRFKTKIIFYYSGLVQLMPLFAFFLLIFILGNISFPGTSSFIGEFLILNDVVNVNFELVFFIGLILFLCTVYSLYLYNRVIFGNLNILKINYIFDLTRREFNIIIPFFLFVFWLGFYPLPFIKLIESSVYYLVFNF